MAVEKTTFCRICENQCGLRVQVENDRIIRVLPDDEHVASHGYACIKGLKLENMRASPDRITTPLKKQNGTFVPISWDQALTEIGAKVRALRQRHGNNSVGVYYGNPVSFTFLIPTFVNGFAKGLGTAKVFNSGSLDCNNKFVVSQQMYGAPLALTFPDVPRLQFLVIIGANPAVSKTSFINLPAPMEQLRAIEARGGRVINVNPRRTETAHKIGEHQFIRPDTDAFFLFAFLNEVIRQGGVDRERVAAHMKGLDQLTALAAPWTAERQAEVTGIDAETLRRMVADYLAADGAALYASTGINQGSNGTLAFWALETINAISGNLDRLGGTLVGRGIVDFTKNSANVDVEFRSRVGNVSSFLGALPVGLMADEILQPGDDAIKAMFVFGSNPMITATRCERMGQALESLELLVSVDMVRSATAEKAHYILPGTHFSERPDIPFLFFSMGGMMPVPWFQYTDALVRPPGECRDECWTLARLGQVCRAPLFGSRIFQGLLNLGGHLKRWPVLGPRLTPMPERMLGLLLRVARLGGLTKMRRYPHGMRLADHPGNDFLGKRVATADGKLDLAPSVLLEQARQRLEPAFAKALQQRDRLSLITKRERYTHNSWAHNDPIFVKGSGGSNHLHMHPADARQRGLSEGQQVRVSSAAGAVTVAVTLDEDMMPGAVALPHGWGHQQAPGLSTASRTGGANANVLAADGPDALEPLSGMAQFNGILVEVTAAEDAARAA